MPCPEGPSDPVAQFFAVFCCRGLSGLSSGDPSPP
jgi:hypothetical protein